MSNAADIGKDSAAAAAPGWRSRLREYARLMRLDRPIGIWLLLWPVLWALWISADGHPDERIFVIFVDRHVRDALGRLRDQRLRRSRVRPARAPHRRPAARAASVSPAEALALFAVLGTRSRSRC